MSDEDEFQEVTGAARSVAETNRLFRLSPVTGDPAQTSIPSAIIAAETEDDARAIAAKADPMGRDWNDRHLVDANYQDTPERHVTGDVIFRSIPSPVSPKSKKTKKV